MANKKKKDIYIVVHQISEDGKVFRVDSEYTGEHAGRFLKEGQVRKKG